MGQDRLCACVRHGELHQPAALSVGQQVGQQGRLPCQVPGGAAGTGWACLLQRAARGRPDAAVAGRASARQQQRQRRGRPGW